MDFCYQSSMAALEEMRRGKCIDFDGLDYSQIRLDMLPTEPMRIIAELCGVKTAILIMENLGGRSITITKTKAGSLYAELSLICGKERADAIFSNFAGETLCIPLRRTVLRLIIDQLALDADMTSYLIYTYGINKSTVYSIFKEGRTGKQGCARS